MEPSDAPGKDSKTIDGIIIIELGFVSKIWGFIKHSIASLTVT